MAGFRLVPVERKDHQVGLRCDGVDPETELRASVDAIGEARHSYLRDCEILHERAVFLAPGLKSTWLNPALARSDNLNAGAFHVYFLAAKIRILNERLGIQAIESEIPLADEIERFFGALCAELGIVLTRAASSAAAPAKPKGRGTRQRVPKGTGEWLPAIAEIAKDLTFQCLHALWLGHKIGKIPVWFERRTQANFDVRFRDLPERLAARGVSVGYAGFDRRSEKRLGNLAGYLTGREKSLPVDWFLPRSQKRAIRGHLARDIAAHGDALASLLPGATPEFAHLVSRVRAELEFGRIEDLIHYFLAFQNFAKSAKRAIFINTTSANAPRKYLFASAAHAAGHRVINAPFHLVSSTRPSSFFTPGEVSRHNREALPDWVVVDDLLSKDTLLRGGFPGDRVLLGNASKIPSAGGRLRPRRDGGLGLLVILQTFYDNPAILSLVRQIAPRLRPGSQIFLKPHPNFPLAPEQLGPDPFAGIPFRVLGTGDLEDWIPQIDACLSVYSTMALEMMLRGVPALWIPFLSENALVIWDLIRSAGIVARSPEHLAEILEGFASDGDRLDDASREALLQATRLVISAEDRTDLADLVLGLLSGQVALP